MNINSDSMQMYLERMFKPGWTTTTKNHWHPCCQEHPNGPLKNNECIERVNKVSEDLDRPLAIFKCPRGHEYEAPEAFIITTPDLACNSGPVCIYCYVNWFSVNLGAEELNAGA